MENNRKKKIIFGVLILIILILVGIYFLFLKKEAAQQDPNTEDSSGFDFPSFFPFNLIGDNNNGDNTSNNNTNNQTDPNQNNSGSQDLDKKPRFFQITKVPSISSPVYIKNNVLHARYIESTTGNIHEINFETRNITRLSNKTISGIVDASWNYNGKKLIGKQYTKDGLKNIGFDIIDSTASSTNGLSTFSALRIFVVDPATIQAVFEAKSDRFFSLTQTNTGTEIYLNNSGADKKRIADSPFTEWILTSPGKDTLLITSKASSATRSYMYKVNLNNGNLSKVVGTKKGLTTLSNPNGTKILYSEFDQEKLSLHLLNTTTGSTTDQYITTLPDKCVWLNNNDYYCAVPEQLPKVRYPDDWYKGKISFVDSIYFVETTSGLTTQIFEPLAENAVSIDGIDLRISDDNKILIIKNKKDLSLWALDLSISPFENEAEEGE